MKDLRDGFLYEHLPKVSKLMDDELERNISKNDFPAELDQKIYLLIEKEARKRFYIPKVVAIFFCIISMTTITMAVDAASGGKIYAVIKEFFGAEEITDENQNMIGAEPLDESSTEIQKDNMKTHWNDTIHYAPGVLSPISITGFNTVDGETPEVILFNGECILFYQEEYSGWDCKVGDVLRFEFEKYEKTTEEDQRIRIGYILDDVMHNSIAYDEVKGCYQLNIEKDGEYFIYVINASSDYITLKKGKIY